MVALSCDCFLLDCTGLTVCVMSLFERLEARDGVDASTLASVSSSAKRNTTTQSENPAKRSKSRKPQGMRAATAKEFNKRLASPTVRGQKHNSEDDPHIFSATKAFDQLHPPLPAPEDRWGWQEEQTYADFVDMGARCHQEPFSCRPDPTAVADCRMWKGQDDFSCQRQGVSSDYLICPRQFLLKDSEGCLCSWKHSSVFLWSIQQQIHLCQ